MSSPDPEGTLEELAARLRSAGCVYAEDEAALLLADGRPVGGLLSRRLAGEPLEQVLGWAEFGGARYAVAPGVFVPRRRSELLVELAVAAVEPGSLVVDACCGVGAIGAAIARSSVGPDPIELHACDVDPAAVGCARANLAGLGEVYEGDLLQALPGRLRGRVRVIVANAPYVPTDRIASMPREARDHERPAALDGGPDGLALHRRLVPQAAEWLAPGGALVLECAADQLPALLGLCAGAGLDPSAVRDHERDAVAVLARRPTARISRLCGGLAQ